MVQPSYRSLREIYVIGRYGESVICHFCGISHRPLCGIRHRPIPHNGHGIIQKLQTIPTLYISVKPVGDY